MSRLGSLAAVSAALLMGADPARPPDLVTGSFARNERRPAGVTLIDWNIDRGQRLDRVVATLQKHDPDVCLLQEVDLHARRSSRKNIAEEIAKTLRFDYVFATAFQELGQGDSDQPAFQGQAILSKLPIQASRVLHFEKQTSFWKPRPYLPKWGLLQRRLGGRIALVAELKAGDRPIVVYDLHLESRGLGWTRLAQLDEVLADARRYPRDVPVIIGGDLNTKYRAGLFVSRLEREGFHSCFGDRRVRTHVIAGALDWIFVRGPMDCGNSEVIRGSKASDHDALTAKLNPR